MVVGVLAAAPAAPARAQGDLRVLVGALELTHEYGALLGLPLGDGPFSLEGQLGPGGAGASLNLAWPLGPHDDRGDGAMWFVSAGIGPYFQDSNPGHPVGGVYTVIGGLRLVIGGGEHFHITDQGGLTFEAGLGVFQTTAGLNPGGRRNGPAGRLAVGWEF